MLRSSFLIAVLMIWAPFLAAQADSECMRFCAQDPTSCHDERSQILFSGVTDSSSSCMRAYAQTTEKMDYATRLRTAIQELDQALSEATLGRDKRISFQLDKAAALISLAGTQLTAGDIEATQGTLSQAADIYKAIRSAATEPGDAGLTARIAVGLLRCGKPLEALAALQDLPPHNGERMYLTAEFLNTLGQRKAAALAYENWISGGCVSKLALLSEDEFGEKWVFTVPMTPRVQTRCEQLPAELRSRLDTLRMEFGHPRNLPERTFPAEPFPARVR
jgi:tetratricopeptide (TPR) repeat protein